MATDREAEIAALRAQITAAEDQMVAGFAEQISIHEQIGDLTARIEKLISEAGEDE